MSAVSDGLVFAYDMYNTKSWKGAPATNLVNQTSAYPDIGNTWGTYNTNQYNSNTYWEWGTSPSVSNNILTWGSVSRTVHQYDCIRPQTSGGGLTAGRDYTIRKINSTQFTIHEYNADQDGSEGYDVHNKCNNDTRVAISASGFPTMWWGAPHRPNAGLVKEIISDGFKHRGRTHSCIRLNYDHRDAGGGLDGWAYGGSVPSSTGGATYTISWYRRAVDENAVGADPGFSMYSGGGWSLTRISAVPLSMDWERVVYRGTPPANAGTNFYWWPNGSNSYEVSEIMWTQTDYAPEFCTGTRSNTEALLDLTGNSTITVNSLIYTDDNTFKFNGSNSYLDLGADVEISPDNQGWTTEYWFKTDNAGKLQHFSSANTDEFNANWLAIYNSKLAVWNRSPGYWRYGDTILQSNTWYQAVFIFDAGGTNMRFYINGKREGGDHVNNVWSPEYSSLVYRYVGTYHYNGSKSRWFEGEISKVKVYDRALTANEVNQNFNAIRSRYGI